MNYSLNKKIIFLFILVSFSFVSHNQTASKKIILYWGSVANFEWTTQELQQIDRIEVIDTIKNRKISEVLKFRFIMQPLLDGPVKVSESNGPEFNQTMKNFILSSKPGDRIVLTDIFAFVENQGNRQIPTAAVFEVK